MSWSANDFAAACAAASLLGATSVACIESDTSITRTTVARLRGTFASACGPASATVSSATAMSSAAAGRWRYQPGRFGAIRSSSSRLVNSHGVAAAAAQQQDVGHRQAATTTSSPASHRGR